MKQGRRIILPFFLLVLTFSLIGCFSQQSSSNVISNPRFTESGLPAKQFLVGGGFSINYTAPADGTLYWVEETTEKILETKSVITGEKIEFGSDGMDPENVKQALGIELKDAKFSLYFIPK